MTQDNHNNEVSVSGNEQEKNNEGAIESFLLSCNRGEILKECAALIVYISRHGDVLLDDEGNALDKELKDAYEKLIEGVMKCNSNKASSEDWQTLVKAYTEVTRFTYKKKGVNGRSVLDTLGGTMRIFQTETEKPQRWWRRLRLPRWLSCSLKPQHKPMCYAVIFLLTALLLELLTGWAGRISDPDQLAGSQRHLYNSIIDLAHILVPAFWGAIGACVFLMKRISDKLGMLAYEQSRQKGIETRILLGAILAVVSVEMMFPTHSQDLAAGEANLGPTGLAFIVGLSIKPIYGAFETLAQGIAERLSPKK